MVDGTESGTVSLTSDNNGAVMIEFGRADTISDKGSYDFRGNPSTTETDTLNGPTTKKGYGLVLGVPSHSSSIAWTSPTTTTNLTEIDTDLPKTSTSGFWLGTVGVLAPSQGITWTLGGYRADSTGVHDIIYCVIS